MDEREKSIRAIEEKRDAEIKKIDTILCTLGRLILERSNDGRISSEKEVFDRSRGRLAFLTAERSRVEKDAVRLAEIEAQILEEIHALQDAGRLLEDLYPVMGAIVMEREEYSAFCAIFKEKRKGILRERSRVQSKNDESSNINKNILQRIAQAARSAIYRGQIARLDAAEKKLFAEAGKNFADSGLLSQGGTDTPSFSEAQKLVEECAKRNAALSKLRTSREDLVSSFGLHGSSSKKLKEIDGETETLNGSLMELYTKLGKRALDPSSSYALEGLLDEDTSAILEQAAASEKLARDFNDQITKLHASIEIDEEREGIEKAKKAILEQKLRIEAAQAAITMNENRIAEAERRISKLEAR